MHATLQAELCEGTGAFCELAGRGRRRGIGGVGIPSNIIYFPRCNS